MPGEGRDAAGSRRGRVPLGCPGSQRGAAGFGCHGRFRGAGRVMDSAVLSAYQQGIVVGFCVGCAFLYVFVVWLRLMRGER